MSRLAITLILAAGVAAPAWSHDSSDAAAQELARLKTEYADVLALQGTSREELLAIARILRARPVPR